MLYREIIAVCSQIHTENTNTLCGQTVELLNVKLAVHIVTNGLYTVKANISKIWISAFLAISHLTELVYRPAYYQQLYGARHQQNVQCLYMCAGLRICKLTTGTALIHLLLFKSLLLILKIYNSSS